MSRLAQLIEDRRKGGMTYAEMVRNAAIQNIEVSDEFFRFTRNDGHKGPLKDDAARALAAGLKETVDVIRAADDARWRDEPAAVPVASGVDPELLEELADSSPEVVQRVKDFLAGIRSRS